MTIDIRPVPSSFEGVELEGWLACDPARGPSPTVLIFPTVMGRSDLELGFARQLVALGYTAFVADLYGKANIGCPREECRPLMDALRADRPGLQRRLLHVLAVVRDQAPVARESVAAIGYCFGGLCALDLARTGANVRGVASFHGLFTPPGNHADTPIGAKVIVFHGWDDPMVPPDEVTALAAELTRKGADWQIHAYGHTKHGFTNPGANMPEIGVIHNETAARRSWAALEDFLAECLA